MGIRKKWLMATGSGSTILKLLRSDPEHVMSRKGFICTGGALQAARGGRCSLTCTERDGVYELGVDANGTGDYFIPWGQSEARFCDVPKNAPDGTLVVTFRMNGCALEVHEFGRSNRFLHDSDGVSLDGGMRQAKCRVDADMYEGPGAAATARWTALPGWLDEGESGWRRMCYEHTLICVKQGQVWNVYQTAIVSKSWLDKGDPTTTVAYEHIKNGPPVHVGVFSDA